MSKLVMVIFIALSIGSIYMTYEGIGLSRVEPIYEQDSSYGHSTRVSSHSSSYGGSSGGFSFGK